MVDGCKVTYKKKKKKNIETSTISLDKEDEVSENIELT